MGLGIDIEILEGGESRNWDSQALIKVHSVCWLLFCVSNTNLTTKLYIHKIITHSNCGRSLRSIKYRSYSSYTLCYIEPPKPKEMADLISREMLCITDIFVQSFDWTLVAICLSVIIYM